MKYADQIITIVCDDIRREVGNKRSLMGIYDDIIVESIPQLMPKICLAVSFRKIKKAFNSIKSIKVVLRSPSNEKAEIPELTPPGNLKIGRHYNMDLFVIPFKIDQVGKFVWEVRFNEEQKPAVSHEFVVRTINKPKELT